MKYISKANEWYDEGTEAFLICETVPGCGLFEGIRNGRWDEEHCPFDEFDIYDDDGNKIE